MPYPVKCLPYRICQLYSIGAEHISQLGGIQVTWKRTEFCEFPQRIQRSQPILFETKSLCLRVLCLPREILVL